MPGKLLFVILLLTLAACSDPTSSDPDPAPVLENENALVKQDPMEESTESAGESPSRPSLEQIQDELDIPVISRAWTGGFDGMLERRIIRVLTVYSVGKYYIDQGQEKGITYELFKMFEDELNRQLGKKHIRIHVVFIPVARDELIPGLISGRGDIAAAGLTITPEREELVDFSNPLTRELSEILVTHKDAPVIASVDDLAGQDMYVRLSSSYRASLEVLNRRFREEGREEINILEISEYLEDEDILEMVNSGTLNWTVVDDYKAGIWLDVFDNLTARNDIVFRSGGRLAWAIRQDSPKLLAAVNDFVKSHRQGTLKGNILINRYISDFDWTQNALSADDYERYEEVVDIFAKYGHEYGIDYLIVTAQGYQESRLEQSARSAAGAMGIMQLLPTTAADPNVGIPDISTAEANIHAGVRYLDFIRNRYFNDPEIDDNNKTLFALAAYNAGPARVARLRKKAQEEGYDPNKWFNNVEMIAAREIGRETVQYVSNILKYYVVYRLSIIRMQQRHADRELLKDG